VAVFHLLPHHLQVWINRLLRRPTQPQGRRAASIVPTETIAGNALIMVITIMTFLASLSIGAVDVVNTAANSWESQIAREVTIQIKPQGDRDIDKDVDAALEISRKTKGVSSVRAYSDKEIGELLQPWLGTGFSLENLPTPRLLVLQLDDSTTVNWNDLRQSLSQVPTATLDDHRLWLERLRAVGRNFVMIGVGIVGLVMVATVLCVLFATRGAMSGNSDIVDVLHIVGAKDSFIARAFERRFLVFGLKGGALGGGFGFIMFLLASWLWGGNARTATESTQALFGNMNIGFNGYLGVILVVGFIALLTAFTSRIVVLAHLRHLP
jgi:cell division transport system permease protein